MRFIGETRRAIITVGSSFLLRRPVSSRSRRDEVSTERGRDTSFNPTGEDSVATRQVSPNDLSSKKLLCLFLLRPPCSLLGSTLFLCGLYGDS